MEIPDGIRPNFIHNSLKVNLLRKKDCEATEYIFMKEFYHSTSINGTVAFKHIQPPLVIEVFLV